MSRELGKDEINEIEIIDIHKIPRVELDMSVWIGMRLLAIWAPPNLPEITGRDDILVYSGRSHVVDREHAMRELKKHRTLGEYIRTLRWYSTNYSPNVPYLIFRADEARIVKQITNSTTKNRLFAHIVRLAADNRFGQSEN